MKNIYNLSLPPRKILTIDKIVIHSIHGKCFMCYWRIGQEGHVLTIWESFAHSYYIQTMPTHACLVVPPHIGTPPPGIAISPVVLWLYCQPLYVFSFPSASPIWGLYPLPFSLVLTDVLVSVRWTFWRPLLSHTYL